MKLFFVFQCPEHGISKLSDRLLLFRHDYSSPNILHYISSASEIEDEVLVEIVLSGKLNCVRITREASIFVKARWQAWCCTFSADLKCCYFSSTEIQ